MTHKLALVIGVTGQDGAYLAKLLLEKNYQVIGTSRSLSQPFLNLLLLEIKDKLQLVPLAVANFKEVFAIINKYQPTEIYNLSGQTSLGLSFEKPTETYESISTGTFNILESIRQLKSAARFFNAGSSECFGNTHGQRANDQTPFQPGSPYAVAKASATDLTRVYRDSYGLHSNTGILFNHESPLRPERFVTQKIIHGAAKVKMQIAKNLKLGNLNISRDWGWAPEYVEAMWLMLQQENPGDYVLATGKTVSLEYFVEKAFAYFDLDWKQFVETQSTLLRPFDIPESFADVTKAYEVLNWKAQYQVENVIEMMCKETIIECNFEKS